MNATRTLTEARAYWDESDPSNPGWAFNLYFDDGHEESGPIDAGSYGDAPVSEFLAIVEAYGREVSVSDIEYDDHGDYLTVC